jgi:hypothetical protein
LKSRISVDSGSESRQSFFGGENLAVEIVYYCEFGAMEFVGCGGASIVDQHYIETFVGKTAHGTGNTLVGEDAGDDDTADTEIIQNETERGSGHSAVSGFA